MFHSENIKIFTRKHWIINLLCNHSFSKGTISAVKVAAKYLHELSLLVWWYTDTHCYSSIAGYNLPTCIVTYIMLAGLWLCPPIFSFIILELRCADNTALLSNYCLLMRPIICLFFYTFRWPSVYSQLQDFDACLVLFL